MRFARAKLGVPGPDGSPPSPPSRQNTRWGSSNTPFTRWLPAEYQDNVTLPKGWDHNLRVNNHILPLVTALVPPTA